MKPILEAVQESLNPDSPQALFDKMVADYEAQMQQKINEYEKLVAESTATLQRLVTESSPQKEIPDPIAQWISTDDGEEYLALNQTAAAIFTVVFDRMQEIVAELSKQIK